jgi:hypothetical protein
MPKLDSPRESAGLGCADLAREIIERAPDDIIFTLQFLGEAQYKVLRYFQDLVIGELAARGIRREDTALLQIFVDRHAAALRDFVFAGASLARPFRIEEIERLLGDGSSVLRTDIWDALRSHIDAAESKFRREADDLPRQLAAIEADAGRIARR